MPGIQPKAGPVLNEMMPGDDGGEMMMGAVELTPRLPWITDGGDDEDERADDADEEGDDDEGNSDGGDPVTPDVM